MSTARATRMIRANKTMAMVLRSFECPGLAAAFCGGGTVLAIEDGVGCG